VLPRREDLTGDRGVLIVAYASHKKKTYSFFLLQVCGIHIYAHRQGDLSLLCSLSLVGSLLACSEYIFANKQMHTRTHTHTHAHKQYQCSHDLHARFDWQACNQL